MGDRAADRGFYMSAGVALLAITVFVKLRRRTQAKKGD
jgi:hypothetical protein